MKSVLLDRILIFELRRNIKCILMGRYGLDYQMEKRFV